MEATSGYGSREAELCSSDCAERHTLGELESPERVSYWVPRVLKNGNTAPVVVYMHAFFAPVPEIYQHHIDHLTRQGYIVIFPQYHAASWSLLSEMGIFKAADQGQWLVQAIASTQRALGLLGDVADKSQIYGYGHSVVGLLLLGWDSFGGPRLKGLLLSHPKPDLKCGMPAFVRRLVEIKELPWRQLAKGVTGRVMILGGEDDKISTPSEMSTIPPYLENAESVAVYIAKADSHAEERLSADHMNPVTNAGLFKHLDWMMRDMGGKITLNTYDYRYYFAGLDALLNGHQDFVFDMGTWSDGHPFAQVNREY
jgi:dienelactone hydrolase